MNSKPTPMQELVKEFENIQKNKCKTAQEVLFFDGVLAIITAKYLNIESAFAEEMYLKGATDYCKSPDNLKTFIENYKNTKTNAS